MHFKLEKKVIGMIDKKKTNKQASLSSLLLKLKQLGLGIVKIFTLILCFSMLLVVAINDYMWLKTRNQILSPENLSLAAEKGKFDYIIILGAGVRPNGEPSPMLQERIDKGIEAYHILQVSPVLMSGDSLGRYYQETRVMTQKAREAGLPEEDILEDRYGLSTYDSIWRLKEIFAGKKVLIITQSYHLIRSIYLAQSLGIEAYGLDAQKVRYSGQFYRDIREVLARVKDFGLGFLRPPARYIQMDER